MDSRGCIAQLESAKDFFDRSTRCLGEDDASFAPTEGAMTAAQQVAHVAQTVDWFMEGAFRPEGFAMDWEEQAKMVMAIESLSVAREWLDRSFASAIETATSKSGEELSESLPPKARSWEAHPSTLSSALSRITPPIIAVS